MRVMRVLAPAAVLVVGFEKTVLGAVPLGPVACDILSSEMCKRDAFDKDCWGTPQ